MFLKQFRPSFLFTSYPPIQVFPNPFSLSESSSPPGFFFCFSLHLFFISPCAKQKRKNALTAPSFIKRRVLDVTPRSGCGSARWDLQTTSSSDSVVVAGIISSTKANQLQALAMRVRCRDFAPSCCIATRQPNPCKSGPERALHERCCSNRRLYAGPQ